MTSKTEQRERRALWSFICGILSGQRTAAVSVAALALLAVSLEAAESPISIPGESATEGAPVSSPAQPTHLTWKDRQGLLTEGSNLTAAQAALIESELKRDPGNEAKWARLLAYVARQSSQTNALSFATVYARVVKTHPGSVLTEPTGMNLFSPLLMDESFFELVASAWGDVAQRQATNVVILRRAGQT